jgi:glycosyltransferase involved in cell wall biosynthesis
MAIRKNFLAVLIPVYNEEKTIIDVLNKVVKLPFVKEVIVVNDASKDKSWKSIQSVKNSKIKAFAFTHNQGKTAAIKEALRHVTAEALIIQDADLEYDPSEIEEVIAPIASGQADVVYGSRFVVRKTARVLYFYHYLANKFLTFLSNVLTNLNMSDIETGYKAFRSPILVNLPLSSKGFGMEVEITALIAKLSVRIYEVPISYYGRTYEEGKKIGMKDGIAAIWYIFYYNLIAPKLPRYSRYITKVKSLLRN